MKVEWKTIPGFTRYQISNNGELRSINYKNSGITKILKPALDQGYYKTMIQNDNGDYKTIRIHQLVMISFIGPRKDYLEVNHKDGNKQNNKLHNLEYCTRSENQKHAYRLGLQKLPIGSLNPFAKLTEKEVLEIREYKKKFGYLKNRKEIAQKYNISEAHLKDIASGRRNNWNHVFA